jgi:hypothetical protein
VIFINGVMLNEKLIKVVYDYTYSDSDGRRRTGASITYIDGTGTMHRGITPIMIMNAIEEKEKSTSIDKDTSK